ncbi:hypothetical protein [Thermomonas sp.]|uniref:hypothetical protein n=1 Tax=Thermomonas sp. TaxID=1971895 RepID=UPI0035AEB348
MTFLRSSILAASVAVVIGLALSGQADAADRRVRIVNNTSYTMVRFYASRVSSGSWEEDILGESTLRPGRSVRIDIDDGSGACVYDFKAVFSDGDAVIREGVNVCKVGEYTYND